MEFSKLARQIAWSESRLKSAETCPKQFNYLYVAGIKPDSEIGRQPIFMMGSAAHKILELMLQGATWEGSYKTAIKSLYIGEAQEVLAAKNNIISFCKTMLRFRNQNPTSIKRFDVEAALGVNWNLQPCQYYGDNNIAIRLKVDLLAISKTTLIVIDHKFSKNDSWDNSPQLYFYAGALQSYFPEITKIRAGIHFIPLGKTKWYMKGTEGYGNLREKMIKRVNTAAENVLSDQRNIGKHCSWCSVRFTCQKDSDCINMYVQQARK